MPLRICANACANCASAARRRPAISHISAYTRRAGEKVTSMVISSCNVICGQCSTFFNKT